MKKVRIPKDSPPTPPCAIAGIQDLPVSALAVVLESEADKVVLHVRHEWSHDVHTYLLTIPAAKLLGDLLHDAVDQYLRSGELDQDDES